jgi:hypothetical protein
VVAEQHVLVGRHVVQAVVVAVRGGLAVGVQPQHLVGDEQAVVAVGDEVGADRGGHHPQGVDAFTTGQGHGAERECADHGHDQPHQVAADAVHAVVSSIEPAESSRDDAQAHPSDRAVRPRGFA